MSEGEDTRTRAQSKRDARQEKRDAKVPFGAQGLTRKELSDAEDELDAAATQRRSSHGIVWTALVDQWQALDYQRETARTAYSRIIELKKRGRTADTKALVQVYAGTKQELQALEEQMLKFLSDEDFGDAEIKSFLYDQRAVPGKGMLIRPPEVLVEILEARLRPSDRDGNGARDAEPAMRDLLKGPEVHGGDSG